MIRKGHQVHLKPEWQDAGDDQFTWIALEDEDGGRVKIATLIPDFTFLPVEVVQTRMLVGGDSSET
jgi:hypothetical protein